MNVSIMELLGLESRRSHAMAALFRVSRFSVYGAMKANRLRSYSESGHTVMIDE